MKLTKIQQRAYNSLNYEWKSDKQLGENTNILNELCKLGLVEHRYFWGVAPRNRNQYRRSNIRYLEG